MSGYKYCLAVTRNKAAVVYSDTIVERNGSVAEKQLVGDLAVFNNKLTKLLTDMRIRDRRDRYGLPFISGRITGLSNRNINIGIAFREVTFPV